MRRLPDIERMSDKPNESGSPKPGGASHEGGFCPARKYGGAQDVRREPEADARPDYAKRLAIDPVPAIKHPPISGMRWWNTRKRLEGKRVDLIQTRAIRRVAG